MHTLTNMHDHNFNMQCVYNVKNLNATNARSHTSHNNTGDFTVFCLDCRCFHHLKYTEKFIPPKGNLIFACKDQKSHAKIRYLMQRSDISSMVVMVLHLILILLLLI